MDVASEASTAFITEGSTVTLKNSEISRNAIPHSFGENAIIEVYTFDYEDFLGDQYYEYLATSTLPFKKAGILRLQNCTFSDNQGPYTLASKGISEDFAFESQIYSDVQRPVYLPKFTSLGSTLPLEQAPSNRPGIDDTNPWFLDALEVCFNSVAPWEDMRNEVHSPFWQLACCIPACNSQHNLATLPCSTENLSLPQHAIYLIVPFTMLDYA